jgi:hypothetical protein
MDIDVFAPSHEFFGSAPGALQFCQCVAFLIGGSSAKKKGVCGEHIDARARTSGTRSSRIVLAGTHSRHNANLEGCEPAA